MIKDISGELLKSAIVKQIRSDFVQESNTIPPLLIYPNIYKEQIVQDVEKPAFFVKQIKVEQDKLMRDTIIRDYQMQVRYHGLDDDLSIQETLAEIGSQLMLSLRRINLELFNGEFDTDDNPKFDLKPLFGKQMEMTVTENVLQVYVTYTVKFKNLDLDKIKMKYLDLQAKLKEKRR